MREGDADAALRAADVDDEACVEGGPGVVLEEVGCGEAFFGGEDAHGVGEAGGARGVHVEDLVYCFVGVVGEGEGLW